LTFQTACCAASAPRNGSAFRLPPVALIHTCYRITDIDRSVAFYEALGFQEVGRIPIHDEAVNVFMNQPGDGDMPRLELTYNFGVDSYDLGTAANLDLYNLT
jgi:catechol 2,3-dioxygenase-like lactoylglutathione lyase family enzyme